MRHVLYSILNLNTNILALVVGKANKVSLSGLWWRGFGSRASLIKLGVLKIDA
jgi:hypothetical protein